MAPPTGPQLSPFHAATRTRSAVPSFSAQVTCGALPTVAIAGYRASFVASVFSTPPTASQTVPVQRFTRSLKLTSSFSLHATEGTPPTTAIDGWSAVPDEELFSEPPTAVHAAPSHLLTLT